MSEPKLDISEHPCTLSLWREVPRQVGRVKMGGNPCQKMDFQKLLPGTINQGCLQ
jgi:hypothetical protein